MEKKRRARINESLLELRTLLADADVSTGRTHCCTSFQLALGSDEAHMLLSTVSFQDGECRSAGDDSEKGGGHTEEQKSRSGHIHRYNKSTEPH